jgi:hypothetical protein
VISVEMRPGEPDLPQANTCGNKPQGCHWRLTDGEILDPLLTALCQTAERCSALARKMVSAAGDLGAEPIGVDNVRGEWRRLVSSAPTPAAT